MKFCEECGAELEDDAVFCEECGASIESSQADETIEQSVEQSVKVSSTKKMEKKESEREKQEKKSVGAIAGAVVVVGALAGVVFLAKDQVLQNPASEVVAEKEEETAEPSNTPVSIAEEKNESQQDGMFFDDARASQQDGTSLDDNGETQQDRLPLDDTSETQQDRLSWDDTSETQQDRLSWDEENETTEVGEDFETDDALDDIISEETEQEYILPNSASQYLSKSDLEGLDAMTLRLARNEIYARHGRTFDDPNLQSYFDSCSWYIGTISPNDFQEAILNKYEIANRDLIVAYEQKK